MKKVGICTINDNSNFGNRLQNYAVQEFIKDMGFEVFTLQNECWNKINKIFFLKKMIKKCITTILPINNKIKRLDNFNKFNNLIKFDNRIFNKDNIPNNLENKYDYFITGSDQVWNPYFGRMSEIDFLTFAPNNKRISFSASFGVSEIPADMEVWYEDRLKGFKNISVREDNGKYLVEKLTGRDDVKVIIDPTMLIESEKWKEISKKPTNLKTEKFILNYFLGNLSNERKEKIYNLANENGWLVINILDKKDPFYGCGPSEFLYLENNAKLVCTDSFHSCVFSILMNTPFLVFEREDKIKSMNSRIDNLLKKFELEDRYFKDNIGESLLLCDYSRAYHILSEERKHADEFFRYALEIEIKEK